VTDVRHAYRSWAIVALCVIAVVTAPWVIGEGVQRFLSEAMLMLAMAQMWNLLAGYAGLVSMGQQVFVGLGAYCLFFASISLKVAPFWVLPLAPLLCAAVAAIVALFMFRLREAYFAIGTWVFSEVVSLLISKTERLGGERGVGLPTARLVDPRWLEPLTFWISAAIAVASVFGTYALLRSRIGLGLMTVRDNDVAAASIGVDVWRNRFIAFVIAAAGCGLAGAVSFTATLYVAPGFAFDPNWVVAMMIIVIIGGIGTLEGPILGVIIYFALREALTVVFGLSAGWYLIGLGLVAIAAILFEPDGLWPLVRGRLGGDWLSVRREPPAPPRIVAATPAAAGARSSPPGLGATRGDR
jgi:branched-chain amino acid transport system permease protein